MQSTEYLIAWGVYLVSATVMAWLSWRLFRKFLWRELAYVLQGFMLAIMYTPWYVIPEEEILAPAIIIFVLDAITEDMVTAVRALIPLVMAMLLAFIVAIILGVIYRVRQRRQGEAAKLEPGL